MATVHSMRYCVLPNVGEIPKEFQENPHIFAEFDIDGLVVDTDQPQQDRCACGSIKPLRVGGLGPVMSRKAARQ